MKRTALCLGIAMLLASVGCSNTSDEGSKPETNFVLEIDSIAESEGTEAASTQAPSTEPASESAIPSVTETTQTETPQTSETSQTSESTAETTVTVNDSGAIIGKWQFVDGYCLEFFKGDHAELSLDYTWVMSLQGDKLIYMEEEYPLVISGNTISANQGETVILKMTAMDGADASAGNGRFLLEPCQVYDDQSLEETQTQTYYVDLKGETVELIMPSKYEVNGNVLRMIDDTGTMDCSYEIQGEVLIIKDETGAQDVLTRVK